MDDTDACECGMCRALAGFSADMTAVHRLEYKEIGRRIWVAPEHQPSPKPRKGLYDALGRN